MKLITYIRNDLAVIEDLSNRMIEFSWEGKDGKNWNCIFRTVRLNEGNDEMVGVGECSIDYFLSLIKQSGYEADDVLGLKKP